MADVTFEPVDRDDTVVMAPVEAELMASVADMPADDVTALGPTPAPRRRRAGLIVTLSLLAVLVVAAIVGFFTARWYFSERVAPGVRFGSVSVVGQNREELTDTVEQAVKDSALTLKTQDGDNVKASLDDLGANVDIDGTVDALLDAKGVDSIGDEFTRINPFIATDVPLKAAVDDTAMDQWLTSTLVQEDEQARPSTVAYDANAKAFAAAEGRDGKSPERKNVRAAVDRAIASPGQTSSVEVTFNTVTMPISLQTAQQAADQANQRLAKPIVLNNSQNKEFTLPADQIAAWIQPKSDLKAGTITLEYDEAAVKSYLAKTLPGQLNQDMVKEKNITDKNGGRVLITEVKGVDAVAVENTDATAGEVVTALQKGEGGQITAKVKVTPHETESRVVDYESPNGDPHAVINLSEQRAYLYRGSTLAYSFNVSTGKPSTATDTGTFVVHTKYKVQTMRGADYVTPNVPWVTYYNGGEGFHGASWNPDGIATGDPRSHGCTNMNVSDAKIVYDFLPVGAMVQVIGSTPTGPVRG